METRLIVPGDAPGLAALHARCFDHAWHGDQIAGSLALPTTRGWVTGERAAVQGFLLCQVIGHEAEILTLCTDPAVQRQGVGRGLLETGMAALTAAGVSRLWLDVAADNTAALALYARCGFTGTGRRAGYYPRAQGAVDALLLECALTPLQEQPA